MAESTEYVRVELPNGAVAMVEATSLASREADVAEECGLTKKFPLSEISGAIEGIVGVVSDALLKVKPKKATVELGIKVGLEAGHLTALIVKGTGEANLKITMEW